MTWKRHPTGREAMQAPSVVLAVCMYCPDIDLKHNQLIKKYNQQMDGAAI
jgi:hypothetical protein